MIYSFIENMMPFQNHLKIRSDGNFLILSSHSLSLYYLQSVSKDFYLKIDGKKSIDSILHELLNEYDVESDVIKKDIIMLVRDFQWKDIIRLIAKT